MELGEFILSKIIETSGSDFLKNLKIGDKVIVELDESEYREAIVESDIFPAPSGAPYISIKVAEKKYAVPSWDLYPLGSKRIINKAYIYSLSHRGQQFSGRSSYVLVFDGKTIKKASSCLGRKEANTRLLDIEILKNYNISQVYSNGLLIYNQ